MARSILKVTFIYSAAGRCVNRKRRPARRALHPVDAALAPGLPAPALPAVGADAVQLHPVASDDEAQEPADPLLEPFEFLAGELHDLPTTLADDVVVLLGLLDRFV